jgi:hypothetical protein
MIVDQAMMDTILDVGAMLRPRVTIKSIEGPRARGQGWICRLRDEVGRCESRIELPPDADAPTVKAMIAEAGADLLFHPPLPTRPASGRTRQTQTPQLSGA